MDQFISTNSTLLDEKACPNVLDIEASGFGSGSYPIEIGYSLGNGERYCALICPPSHWEHWDESAEQLHGITRTTLFELGIESRVLCVELNRRLESKVLYSDAWAVDSVWLSRLYEEAGLSPSFKLRAIEHIQSEQQHMIWDSVRTSLINERNGKRHRASLDAEFIQQVYKQSQRLSLKL